nr:DnaB-like helicase C-terminal domain-containing protein [uncultured Agathobaculum sp.]
MALTDDALRLHREAEESVLGALIADAPMNAADVFRQVRPDDFITGDYRHIFDTCRAMFARDDKIDPYTVRAACGTAYLGLLKKLADMMMTPSNCAAYIRQLRDCAIRYRLDALLHETRSQVAYAAPLPEVAALVERMQIVMASGGEDRGSDMNALLLDYFSQMDERPKFLDWGFPSVTQALETELNLGQYVILSAEPSAGKTAFALSVAVALARQARVTFYTLETDKRRLMQRIMARTALVDLGHIKARRFTAPELEAQARAKAKLLNLPFRIVHASGSTVEQIAADVKASRTDVAIIDYLQLIEPSDPRADEYTTITHSTKTLQQLARSGRVVLALSQLNKEGNLRGSGQILQDADAVLRIGEPPQDKLKTPEQIKAYAADQLRVIKIAKNRDGSRRTLPFWFEGRYQRFVEQWDGFDEAQVAQMEDDPYQQTKIETA